MDRERLSKWLYWVALPLLLPLAQGIGLAGDLFALPSSSNVSNALTCGIGPAVIPPVTQAISANGTNVEVALDFNTQLGGVGVGFYLVNPQVPSAPVDILEARSAAGAGWQFSSLTYTYDGKGILTNQSAGNSVGGQHGYDAGLAIQSDGGINSVSSTQWTPSFSDSYSTSSTDVAQSPCPQSPAGSFVFDNGALDVAAWPVATPLGSVVALEHRYSLTSLTNQAWSSWYAVKALYLNRQVADWGDLRVYVGSQADGWFAGPLYPEQAGYGAQTLVGSDGVDHQIDSPSNDGAHILKTILGADYMVLVWNIQGEDIGVVVHGIIGATLRLNTQEYCSDTTDDTCGSIDLITTDQAYVNPVFAQGSVRSYATHYLVGTPTQLTALGFYSGGGAPSAPSVPTAATVGASLSRVALGTAQSNNALSGWPASSVLNPGSPTLYSSSLFPEDINANGTFLAAWVSGDSPASVRQIDLHARYYNGTSYGFPRLYQVYLTNPADSAWTLAGTYTAQPVNGVAVLNLPAPVTTYGIQIVPVELGVDSSGSNYFQLGEIDLDE